MKIFVSVDMEGISGVVAWEDVRRGTGDHAYFRQQLAKEVKVVCQTALANGASEIMVKDAHASARNLLLDQLPPGVRLFSGWAQDPFIMMSGLDSSFAGAIFVGYHAGAGCDGNPLAHTMSSARIFSFKINGSLVSEFVLNAYIAACHNVPVIAISGDEQVCRQASALIPGIVTMPVKRGIGSGVISLGSEEALAMLSEGIERAMAADFSTCRVPLPKYFHCEICFRDHAHAYRASFYKGVKQVDAHTIAFETDDFYEVLRTYFFI